MVLVISVIFVLYSPINELFKMIREKKMCDLLMCRFYGSGIEMLDYSFGFRMNVTPELWLSDG